MKKLFGILTLILFTSISANAFDGTTIQTDIVVDTVWTKEMSPIYIKGIDEKDKDFMLVNGATLKIEPGVKILMQDGMDFVVTNQCLKGYGNDCFQDEQGNKTYPKLIANGTLDDPIIITSEKINGVKKRWGNFIIGSKGNEMRSVKFEYGGSGMDNFFIKLGSDTIFRNNIIENVGNNAVYLKNVEFKNNVINNANGNGIVCVKKCEIEDVAVINTKGNAITAKEIDTESFVKNNFIYGNNGDGFQLEHYFNKKFEISNNEFVKNGGGVHIYHNNEGIVINNNNFLKNESFAIKSDTYDSKFKTIAKGSFLNIDTGPQGNIGEFFVSKGIDAFDYKVEENSFSMAATGVANKYYQEYLAEKAEDTEFFEILVDREELIGKVNQAGGIIQYEFSFKNLKTKTIEDINFVIDIPKDQEVILCSVSENNDNYSLQDVCYSSNLSKVKYEGNSLKWYIDKVGALKGGGKIHFSTLIKASKEGNDDAALPTITLKNQGFDKKISYTLSETSVINKTESTTNSNNTEATNTSTKKITFTREELIKRKQEMEEAKKEEENIEGKYEDEDDKNEVEQKVEKTNDNGKPYIETGVIFTKILNGNLYFYLDSTETGREYKLLNSDKWYDLVSHIRGENKDKEVRVYGEYYINSYGKKTGIKFNHFHKK